MYIHTHSPSDESKQNLRRHKTADSDLVAPKRQSDIGYIVCQTFLMQYRICGKSGVESMFQML